MRRIHLYASFVVLSFLLLFFISGAVMVMPGFFPRKDLKISNDKIVLNNIEKNKAISDLVAEIRGKYDIHGKEIINETAGQKIYIYKRPGYKAEVAFKNEEDTARIKIIETNFASAMNDFHRLHGYEGNWIHKCWAFMYDLCCLALIAFALTGVYLWWILERKKIYGIIFFIISTGLTAFAIGYLLIIG